MDIEINNIVKINLNLTLKNGAAALGITALSIMTLSITTLSIMTLSIIGLFATPSINDTQQNNIMLSVAIFYCYAACHYA